MQVNIFEAKSQLTKLIKCAQAGEDLVIANRGEPVARLVPVGGTSQRAQRKDVAVGARPAIRPGGLVKWLDDNPLPTYLRRSAEEMDAAIDDARHAWE